MDARQRKTVLILLGLAVVAFLLALGTFDFYLVLIAYALFLATLITAVTAIVQGHRRRQHQGH